MGGQSGHLSRKFYSEDAKLLNNSGIVKRGLGYEKALILYL